MAYNNRLPKLITFFGISLAFFSLSPSSILLAFQEPDRKLADYIINASLAEREKVVSGIVKMKVEEIQNKTSSALEFDYRFDHTLDSVKSLTQTSGKYIGSWMKTPEFYTQYSIEQKNVLTLKKPEIPANKLWFVMNFDLRSSGLMVLGDYSTMPSFSDLKKNLNRYKLESINKMENGRYELNWSHATDKLSIKRTIVFNPNNSYSIEKLTILTQNKGTEKWQLAANTEAKWIQKNSVWVPESISLKGLPGRRIQHTFAWESVNEPLPANEFTLDNMGVPVGTLIYDERLDPKNPILIGKVGENPLIPAPPRPLSLFRYLRPWTMVVVSVALLGVIALFFLRRRGRKTTTTD